MIYVDRKGHMVSDQGAGELHEFAAGLGLRREWFHDKRRDGRPNGHPHYDLTTRKALNRALRAGARLVGYQELTRRHWLNKGVWA